MKILCCLPVSILSCFVTCVSERALGGLSSVRVRVRERFSWDDRAIGVVDDRRVCDRDSQCGQHDIFDESEG